MLISLTGYVCVCEVISLVFSSACHGEKKMNIRTETVQSNSYLFFYTRMPYHMTEHFEIVLGELSQSFATLI